jgi:hypothetical protein
MIRRQFIFPIGAFFHNIGNNLDTGETDEAAGLRNRLSIFSKCSST